jgi:hypothetical protein
VCLRLCAGHSAWQLIQRLAGLHLQHAPLDPATMTGIRAHLLRLEGPALQQLALAFGPEAAAEVSGLLAPPPDVCRQPLGRLGALTTCTNLCCNPQCMSACVCLCVRNYAHKVLAGALITPHASPTLCGPSSQAGHQTRALVPPRRQAA